MIHSPLGAPSNYLAAVRSLLAGAPRAALVRSLGCQQNEADAELLRGMLREMGYTVAEREEDADLILLNTCAVREHAELKALSISGGIGKRKEKNPGLIFCLAGCMAGEPERREQIARSYPYVDILLPATATARFPEALYRRLLSGERQFVIGEEMITPGKPASPATALFRGSPRAAPAASPAAPAPPPPFSLEGVTPQRASDTRAWLPIMSGCDNFCSYCIVPYVRGRERSRPPEEILREARELAAAGYREVTLLGQNVNSYGKGLPGGVDFPALLEQICEIPGDFLVRFMTSHPKDATRRLADVMASCAPGTREGYGRVARQFHLPLQSGSDAVLARMNRYYTSHDYLAYAAYLRERIPEITLSTDIIVGFPGETEDDFEATLSVLRQVRFDNLYAFIFSPRKGTRAAEMPNFVPPDVQKERMARLLELQAQIGRERAERLIGRTLPVLVEGLSKTRGDRLTARTEGGRLVHFAGDDSLIGKVTRVKVTRAQATSLIGELS